MRILDLSKKSYIKNAKHWHVEYNQLYHPTGIFKQDSYEVVYVRNNFDSTTFLPILLKEWFYLLKKNGFLVFDYKPNKNLNFKKLEEYMWWLWQEKYDVMYHGPVSQSNLNSLNDKKLLSFINSLQPQVSIQLVISNPSNSYHRFICKKISSTQVVNDDSSKWTFGIITKGERNDWLEIIISAIRAQKIPHYEIIICGTYRNRKEKDIVYIPFIERDDKGWITKKKNIIAKNAQYENICILHDRIILDKNWFKGIKKYGNCFEVLCNKQILKGTNKRVGDWLTYGSKKIDLPYQISQLEYSDWDMFVYMSGQLSILKKSVWKQCPWNETRYWGEEDIELSYRFRDFGHIIRFNPYSMCTALAWKYGNIPTKYYASQGLLPKDMLARRFMRSILRITFSIPGAKKIISPFVDQFVKLNIYKFLIHH